LSITTNRLLISEGAQVDAGTFGAGKGGNLTINASDSVQVNGTSTDGRVGSTLSTQAAPNATGTAGDLSITTNRLLISEGARVSTGTFGAGKGGNLTINASGSVQVLGTSADGKFGSKVTTQAQGTGDAGDLSIITDRLLIRDGAQVDAATFGAGKGGNLTVDASQDMQVIGTSADGEFGSTLSAQASPNATGDAGDVTITTARLLIKDGAQVRTLTSGAGKGGDLTVNASEEVQLIGTTANGRFASGLFVSADAGSTAGDLIVKTRQMSVRDGAAANVSSTRGQAGNMTISADSLLLNRGRLFAVTGKSTVEGGANITLQGLDLLRMDNESFISASALENANGGNVTIDSTFIVATPPTGSKGSDITANAVRGNGGNVNVTTQGLFGIEFRPKLTPDNDITASSEFGVAGIVNINTPGVDPSRGLSELPSDVVDATQQIDRRCTPAAADKRSSFVITGRGGLPPSPSDTLQGESVITHWVTLDSEESTNHTAPQPYPTRTAPKQLVEAQSWIYGANGEVILIAQAPTATPQSSWQIPPSCDAVGREEKKVFNAEGR
jgi:large exoprotein involved in heme utilization and adhesion